MLSIGDVVEPLEDPAGSQRNPFEKTHILEWYSSCTDELQDDPPGMRLKQFGF
jgi:hypothetical protein